MIEPVVPPFVPVLVVAVLMLFLNRRLGHGLGVVGLSLVVGYVWIVPSGSHLPVLLFGFEAELFRVDGVSRLMGLIFAFIGAIAVGYSWSSDADSTQTAIALGYVGTSLGAVFGGDWLSLIFFWELMAVTSTVLVWHYGGRAVRPGFRYAVIHGIGGTLLLGAVIWQYVEVESFLFTGSGMTGSIAPILALLGIGVNVGFIGLHTWLPDTYPQPHVAASVFLCVYTTKTGVYGMFRAFPDGELGVAYMGGLMAVFGAGMAVMQDDMRRLLSYHIQSQVGYMVAGVGIGGALATTGAFGHVFNHILYKSLLFMAVGVIIYRTGRERLSELGGLAGKMPVTAVTFAIAALSIAGFPGFNGFVSKGMVVTAAHEAHLETVQYLLLIGGVGTFLSFIKLGYYAFIYGEYDGLVADAKRGQAIGMGVVAGLCIVFGLFPSALYQLLPGTVDYTAYTLGHIEEGVVLAALGLGGFVVFRGPIKRIGVVADIDRVINPVVFYGTRAVVWVVTDLYAGVDRVVVRASETVVARVRSPKESLASAINGDQSAVHVDIGRGVLFVAVVVIIGLALVL